MNRLTKALKVSIGTIMFLLFIGQSGGVAEEGSTHVISPIPHPIWQAAAGNKMEFEVASIRQNTAGTFVMPSFAMTPDDGWGPSDGLFVDDDSLLSYIDFAYKLWLSPGQRQTLLSKLPKWVATDSFVIRARASGHPTKDQMRLMLQTLLADRFKLKFHMESQVVPVLALTLVTPGKRGPNLRPHAEGVACNEEGNPSVGGLGKDGVHAYPPRCGVYSGRALSAHVVELASRDTTLDSFAKALGHGYGHLDRPVIDRTGVTGRFDISVQWTATVRVGNSPPNQESSPSNSDGQSGPQETTFVEALKEQCGLKLDSTKAPVDMLLIDHVEQPSEN